MIYLDNNATTALDERVLAAMLPTLRHAGNASSAHAAGAWAREAVETARAKVAGLLNFRPSEVVFTSGGTEANNLAIKGAALAGHQRRRIVSCTTEHASVLESLAELRRNGYEVVLVPVDPSGMIDLDRLEAVVTEQTLLVTVMSANNETGVLAPLREIISIARTVGALIHTDATQLMAWGGLDVDVDVDVVSLSAHKFHGPQGVGALCIRREMRSRLRPILSGGGHERGVRSGTLNTAGIVGMGAAAGLVSAEGRSAAVVVSRLRDRLHDLLEDLAGPVLLNGDPHQRLAGTLNIALPGAPAEAVMAGAQGVAMATGSACSTGAPGPSHVLTAMSIDDDRAACSLRMSLSRMTTSADVELAAQQIAASVKQVRQRQGVTV